MSTLPMRDAWDRPATEEEIWAKRVELEQEPITINGFTVHTDDRSIAYMERALAMDWGSRTTLRWKMAAGWVDISKPELQAVYDGLRSQLFEKIETLFEHYEGHLGNLGTVTRREVEDRGSWGVNFFPVIET